MNKWVEFQLLLKNSFCRITKGSVVAVEGEKFVVKRIDSIILLHAVVGEPNTVKVYARGIKSK